MALDAKKAIPPGPAIDQRILVHAPVGRDNAVTVQFLRGQGLPAESCDAMADLCDSIGQGAAAVVITSESLEGRGRSDLQAALGRQPPWSDIPVILLAGGVAGSRVTDVRLPVGNITVLERPVNPASFLSSVNTALRARRQQYLVRDLLAEAEKARREAEMNQTHIEALNERLQRAMTETHHRVKNNLQIIAAMVDMRAMEDTETVPTEEFRQLGAHIRVLATVHDLLTAEAKRDGQAHSVSAQKVLEKLLPLVQRTTTSHEMSFDLQDARLTVRQGTSLALIANELVSNAVKYGRSRVWVRFVVHGGEANFEVCDDGPGFPPDFDPVLASNTGLELIQHLSRWDLGGSVAFYNRREGGGCACVTMPLNNLT